jgi:hypothetical protein
VWISLVLWWRRSATTSWCTKRRRLWVVKHRLRLRTALRREFRNWQFIC